MILGERDLPGFLAGPQRYRPLYQVMKEPAIALKPCAPRP
jgi:hypothetical protein